MAHLDLWDAFAVLIAVAGPPKVVVSFLRLAAGRDPARMRRLAWRATGAAMSCGAVVALIAEPLLHLFHIGHPAVMVAGGTIFFGYALRLVLHGHPDTGEGAGEGLRALLLPFVASPLALTSVIVLSALKGGWRWPLLIAVAYIAVAAVDLAAMLGLTYVVRHIPATFVEVTGRVLGLLLAAVGVELVQDGLLEAGVIKLTPNK